MARDMLPTPPIVHRRIWLWTLIGLISFVVLATIATIAAVPLTSDALRHRMVQTLSERLDAQVAIGDLHWRVFPTVRARGSDLTIRRRGHSDARPLISVSGFSVEASVAGLLRKRVAHVTLEGLDVEIPPDDDAPAAVRAHASPQSEHASTTTPMAEGVVIDTLDANDGQIVTIPKNKEKSPKVWAIHALRLRNVGAGQAMPFQATLTNAVPPGEIDTTGTFGPWLPDEPGDSALDGTFTFDRADLSIFHGISGILSARGSFSGTLGRIGVDGETNTPDFTVKVGGHPFLLHAKYRTTVDGTNGDTILERIEAKFLESSLEATGSVIDGPPDMHGRIVTLDVTMDRARLEDVMMMAVKGDPPMRGGLRLKTKFVLPPGETDVVDRLRLDGTFAVARARFTNFDVQGRINELSSRSRGRGADEPKDRVVSDFQGRFRLGEGRLALPELTFSVPGAQVELAGRYALKPETLDFQGRLLMDAKVSQTQTGIKSLLLKVVDPLFNRRGGGSQIPIHIRGRRSDPNIGIDMGRVFKRGEKS
jgi:hypothetical protein